MTEIDQEQQRARRLAAALATVMARMQEQFAISDEACSGHSVSPPRPSTLTASITARATSGQGSRRPGRLTYPVKTPRDVQFNPPKRASVQSPMKWAFPAIFEACKTKVRTDRKMPT
jgi:hypothetical protein